MSVLEIWKNAFTDAQNTLEQFQAQPQIWQKLDDLTDFLIRTLKRGGTIFTCGNGGSLCDATHFAEELTGRYRKDRRPLPALALNDPSHLTCVGNDYGFKHVFERQIQALGREGDCLILLSTSGNSENLLLAANAAREKKVQTIGLLGRDGGKLRELCDLSVVVPAHTSDRIQEVHIKIIHIAIEAIERHLFPELY